MAARLLGLTVLVPVEGRMVGAGVGVGRAEGLMVGRAEGLMVGRSVGTRMGRAEVTRIAAGAAVGVLVSFEDDRLDG